MSKPKRYTKTLDGIYLGSIENITKKAERYLKDAPIRSTYKFYSYNITCFFRKDEKGTIQASYCNRENKTIDSNG